MSNYCHNCSSNMRLRSGGAPLNKMLAEGIEVGIGIDEAGINDDRDMLQDLVAAALNAALANAQSQVQQELQRASAGMAIPMPTETG